MAWRDSLAELKEELANIRAERLSQASDEDAEIEKGGETHNILIPRDISLEQYQTLLNKQNPIARSTSA